jgi:hypothetical protein
MKSIAIFFLVLTGPVFGQIRYLNDIFPDSLLVREDFIYASGPTAFSGEVDIPAYRIYNTDDVVLMKPVVIILGSNNTSIDLLEDKARAYARKGYLSVVANYRTNLDTIPPDLYTALYYETEVYRGMQDMHALCRYLAVNGTALGANRNLIFFSGSSLGAVIAWQSFLSPMPSDYGLGDLESIGVETVINYRVKGIQMIRGAAYYMPDTLLPVQFVHGTCDDKVPINEGYFKGVSTLNYMFGPLHLLPSFSAASVGYEALIDCGGGHNDLFYDEPGLIENEGAFFFLRTMKSKPLRGKIIYPGDGDSCGYGFCD